MSWIVQLALALLLLGRTALFACSCVQALPYCSAFHGPVGPDTAIFVGVLKDAYPAETMPDFSAIPLDDWRKELLRVWKGVLSPDEEQRIKAAKSIEDIISPLRGMFWPRPRRVRLEIIEEFTDLAEGNFDLFTGIGDGDCGVPFEIGKAYLVFSHRDASSGRWSADVCGGTRLLKLDDSGLAALRAWKKREPIPRSVWGAIWNGDSSSPRLAPLQLQLESGTNTFHTSSDERGSFAFKNLPAGLYTVKVLTRGWQFTASPEERTVDLRTNTQCGGLSLTVRRKENP